MGSAIVNRQIVAFEIAALRSGREYARRTGTEMQQV